MVSILVVLDRCQRHSKGHDDWFTLACTRVSILVVLDRCQRHSQLGETLRPTLKLLKFQSLLCWIVVRDVHYRASFLAIEVSNEAVSILVVLDRCQRLARPTRLCSVDGSDSGFNPCCVGSLSETKKHWTQLGCKLSP